MEPIAYSQVLRYLKGLAHEHQIWLVSYEKRTDWLNTRQRSELEAEARAAGIRWLPLRYHKQPTAAATGYDLLRGFLLCAYLVRREGLGVVHARSYVASVIALALKKAFGTRFIFDMRGFWADERVECGLWNKGSRLFRVAKWCERRFLLNADTVVALSNAAVNQMRRFDYLNGIEPNFRVITTCTDLDLFQPNIAEDVARRESNTNKFTLGYVGAASVSYLFDPAVECFKLLLAMRPNARIVILNRGEHDYIRSRLVRRGVPLDRVELEALDHRAMPQRMGQMSAGVFFIKQSFSKSASMPTKLGEFLGCGVPCLTNVGVGDVERILADEQAGVTISDFTDGALRNGIASLLRLAEEPSISQRCRRAAIKHFALADGVSAYDGIYKALGRKDHEPFKDATGSPENGSARRPEDREVGLSRSRL